MEITCENCGHVNKFDPPSHLQVQEVFDWRSKLRPETVAALQRHKFSLVRGTRVPEGFEVPANMWSVGGVDEQFVDEGKSFRTLFVTTASRRSLTDLLKQEAPSLQKDIENLYADRVVPILETVMNNFKVLGNLCAPSAIKLAQTDLNQPIAVFCFVTVEADTDFEAKLGKLGLTRLTSEGTIDNISDPAQDWFSMADAK